MILVHQIDIFLLFFQLFNGMYDCMKTLRQAILENIKWSLTIYVFNLYIKLHEINLCLCYLLYF